MIDITCSHRSQHDTLGRGLAAFDPPGLNRLVTDNQRLPGLVEEITAKPNRVAGLGVIEISDRAVQIHDASQPRRCKQTPRGSSRYAPG